MKKYLLIIFFTIFMLVSCSSQESAIADNEFTFTKDEFKSIYEEINDRNMPTNIYVSEGTVTINYANEEETIRFLKAVYELMSYKEVDHLKKSIEEGDKNIPPLIHNDNISIVYDDRYEDELNITIYPDGDLFK